MIGNIIKSTGSWYLIRNDKGEIFNSRLRGKFKLSNHKLSLEEIISSLELLDFS